MEKITLPSGAELQITLLPYLEAWSVVQKLSKVVEKLNIDLKDIPFGELKSVDVLKLTGPIAQILSSNEVIEVAKICFKRCLIDNLKIDDSTFEARGRRVDFLPVVFFVLRENVSPFFGGLTSFFLKR